MHREVNAFDHVKRGRLRSALGAEHRDDRLAHHRAAAEDGLAVVFVRQFPGQDLLRPQLRGAVDDDSHGARVVGLRDEHHRAREVRIRQARLGNQEQAVRLLALLRCSLQGDGQQKRGKQPAREHTRNLHQRSTLQGSDSKRSVYRPDLVPAMLQVGAEACRGSHKRFAYMSLSLGIVPALYRDRKKGGSMKRRDFIVSSAAPAGASIVPLELLAQTDRRKELLIVANATAPNSLDIHTVGANRPSYGGSWTCYVP